MTPSQLRDMPEEDFLFWRAFGAGEADEAREKARRASSPMTTTA